MENVVDISKEKFPKLVLGTAQFGQAYGIANLHNERVSDAELHAILDFAFESGIHCLDCADAYGNANDRIKSYMASFNCAFDLINKIFVSFNGDRADAFDVIDKGFRFAESLSSVHFDTLMLHAPKYLDNTNVIDALQYALSAGLCNRIGVSLNTFEEFSLAQSLGIFSVYQIPVNILNQTFCCEEANSSAVSFHARSVFLQGLLLMDLSKVPSHLNNAKPYLSRIQNLAEALDVSSLILCLMFILAQKHIDCIVVGVQSMIQLEELVSAYKHACNFIESYDIYWPEFSCYEKYVIEPFRWSA